MIVVRLCGGLGNQFFQYAAGRRLAHARQTDLVLDLSWYHNTPSSNTPRVYELDHYNIQARLPVGMELFWCSLHQGRVLGRLPFFPRRWRHRRERAFEFDPAVLALPDNVYLDGYWQSHKYFADVADLIRHELVPWVPMGKADQAVARQMGASEDAVSLHVRRGDYVSNPATAKVHGVCGPQYYAQAIAYLAGRLHQPHFFVFSDDMAWAREHLAIPGAVTYVDHNDADTAYQDMRLMSLCRHHIIANSSFSWWGAWLSAQAGQTVVAPRVWFADQRNTRDLAPEQWVRL